MPTWQKRKDKFIGKLGDKKYLDMIYLADQEATRAERCVYHPQCGSYDSLPAIQSYAQDLKRFIRFMRYGVKPRGITAERFARIRHLREKALSSEN